MPRGFIPTHRMFCEAQQLLMNIPHAATQNEKDAARELITCYQRCRNIDSHVGTTLAGYAQRGQQQDRYGR